MSTFLKIGGFYHILGLNIAFWICLLAKIIGPLAIIEKNRIWTYIFFCLFNSSARVILSLLEMVKPPWLDPFRIKKDETAEELNSDSSDALSLDLAEQMEKIESKERELKGLNLLTYIVSQL